MHSQLHQELRAAQHAAVAGPLERVPDVVARLRSLDLQGTLPAVEYERLELVRLIRSFDSSEARRLWTSVLSRDAAALSALSQAWPRCPEAASPAFMAIVDELEKDIAVRLAPPEPEAPGRRSKRVSGRAALAATPVVLLAAVGVWLWGGRRLSSDDSAGAAGAGATSVATPSGGSSASDPQGGMGAGDGADSRSASDRLSEVERQVAMLVHEVQVMVDAELRWLPIGHGTCFPVTERLYITNRHVVQMGDLARGAIEESLSEFFDQNVVVLDERVVAIGTFGFGLPQERSARVIFEASREDQDDLAIIEIDGVKARAVEFARVPSVRSKVYSVGFPGVSASLGNALQSPESHWGRVRQLIGDGMESDRSLDLVRFYGVHGLSPTTNDGIISKEHLMDGVLQTNAVIAHGNSGGPLLDEQGRVVGVNTWGAGEMTSEGFGASIRSDRVKRILRDSAYHGNVRWGDVDDE